MLVKLSHLSLLQCSFIVCTVCYIYIMLTAASSNCQQHVHAPMQNQFDSLDMSDNVITRLEGFPKLPRLKTLLLSNNRVLRIARNLEGKLLAAP